MLMMTAVLQTWTGLIVPIMHVVRCASWLQLTISFSAESYLHLLFDGVVLPFFLHLPYVYVRESF